MSKILAVFGATGNQGGSVIRAVLDDPILSNEYKIRGITRDISKPAAQALVSQGVELKVADMGSKSSLADAIKGSHTVFLITTTDPAAGRESPELTHGKNVADVTKEAGVQHLIFSSLLHVTDTTNGRLKHVSHFDVKADIERYIRSKGIPSTFFVPGFFMTNLTVMQMLKKGDDGVYTMTNMVGDETQFPLIDIEADTGKYVVAAIKARTKCLGKRILAAADYYRPTRIVSQFEEVTGKKARVVVVDAETFKSTLPPHLGDEALENFLFMEDPGYFAGQSLKESLDLLAESGFKPTTWEEFLEKNKRSF